MKKVFLKIVLFSFLGLFILFSCTKEEEVKITPKEIIENNSPWITTAIYKLVNNTVDKSKNYISDIAISKNTISSAFYKDGKFIFVPVNYATGDFANPITKSLTNNYGKYELMENNGMLYRRVFDTKFGYTHKRKVVKLNEKEFTYEYMLNDNTYYVEHLKYNDKFTNKTYPSTLLKLINQQLTAIK